MAGGERTCHDDGAVRKTHPSRGESIGGAGVSASSGSNYVNTRAIRHAANLIFQGQSFRSKQAPLDEPTLWRPSRPCFLAVLDTSFEGRSRILRARPVGPSNRPRTRPILLAYAFAPSAASSLPRCLPANRPMVITGVAVTAKGLRVPNRRYRAICEHIRPHPVGRSWGLLVFVGWGSRREAGLRIPARRSHRRGAVNRVAEIPLPSSATINQVL